MKQQNYSVSSAIGLRNKCHEMASVGLAEHTGPSKGSVKQQESWKNHIKSVDGGKQGIFESTDT